LLILGLVASNMTEVHDKLYPKDFIRKIYVENLGQLIGMGYYYIGFGLIGIGIEFLGKCIRINQNPKWETPNQGRDNFQEVINDLMKSYKPFIGANTTFDFSDNLRNGMAHAFRPKEKLELTHRKEAIEKGWEHAKTNSTVRLVICCEDLFEDFKCACKEIIRRIEHEEFPEGDKIYQPFLDI